MTRRGATFIVLVGLLCAGCGKGAPGLAPVRGTVYYKGVPIRGGALVFAPDTERGNSGALAHGEIGSDGAYTLRTDKADGAPPGWHRVTITATPGAGAVLPHRYSDPEMSGQFREVVPGKENVLDLRLE